MPGDRDVVTALAAAYDQRDGLEVAATLKDLVSPMDFAHLSALWHPLGFFRLEISMDHLGRRYVLHCWPSGERRTQKPAWLVHQHAFELESLVLDGEIRDQQFRDTIKAAAVVRGPVYRAAGESGLSVLQRSTDVAELEETGEHRHVPGHFYEVSLDRFHESSVRPTASCLTLARISPKTRAHSNVIGEFGVASVLRYRHDSVDSTLLVQLGDHLRGL